ncbi:MAG: hypothetical protein JXJ20_10645 [Anaerolineae bacterium]|nr:hypothetical protein [Anaerolineae bacterium]
MKLGLRLLIGLTFVSITALAVIPAGAGFQRAAQAQGIIAFVGLDPGGQADVYLLDLRSQQVARLDAPATAETDLAWSPDGMLAFTTEGGGYGLLKGFEGCFESYQHCYNTTYVIPPYPVLELEWAPDGELLFWITEQGVQIAPPDRPSPANIVDVNVQCDRGIAVAEDPFTLLCATADLNDDTFVGVYGTAGPQAPVTTLSLQREIGTFPAITAHDAGVDGSAAIGTLEDAGDSGFFTNDDQPPQRLSTAQIHVYALEFAPAADQLAVVGATADSTGDGTLRDGDVAELFLYDPANPQLTHIPGFTGATDVTWAPGGKHLLVITEGRDFAIYNLIASTTHALDVSLPPELQVTAAAWNPSTSDLPPVPTVTPATVPSATPIPTRTPFPTLTPIPTRTPLPSPTPGSPLGHGCEYAYIPPPVGIGDSAEVTQHGAGLRLRASAITSAKVLRELAVGTRMTVINGPVCAQGYRWWRVKLEADGQAGWLADSDKKGCWIQEAEPPMPPEKIIFTATLYNIRPGNCTRLSWDVEGIKEVYYQGEGVTGKGSRRECPPETTTYILKVIRLDGSVIEVPITIKVSELRQ